MKNKIKKILSKPKIVIPVFFIIGIFATIIGFRYIGQAPVVNIKNSENIPIASGDGIDLSFIKTGKIESVLVSEGQEVKKGDILAKLSATDVEGTISQAKGALDLAEAQYSSLNSQYKTTKKQQDMIVLNNYQTMLSGGLEGTPDKQTDNKVVISGTYTCGKEGMYNIDPYKSSDSDTGYSFTYSGLESGVSAVKYENAIPLGKCGLQIKFVRGDYFNENINWTVNIPNTNSATYLANKNTYDLSVTTREKILSDLATNIGSDNQEMSVARAGVDAARGAYEAALGAYENSLIRAPMDGVITFVDSNLKVGQGVVANKLVISIKAK